MKVSGVPKTSYELPESTKGAVEIGNPMSPDLEIIKSLNPTLVVSVDTLGSDYMNLFIENNIPSDAKINYIGKYQELVLNMLKVKEENLTDETSENSVSYNGYTIYYIFDNTKNLEEEKNNLLKEKERLINSIERRKKLLSNENYISKAPQNIVEKEKSDLEKEENNLKNILNTLNEKEAK